MTNSLSVEINHQELRQMILKVWETKISLNLTGTTGIGKSFAIFEQAKLIAESEKREFADWNRVDKKMKKEIMDNPKKYFVFMDIRLSQFDATDLKGLPKLNGDDVVEWLIQNWLYCLTSDDIHALVLFDEMNLSPPSVQASAYQIIRDKCMGDVRLGDNVCIISAGNTSEDKAGVYDMAKPLANRFIHATLLVPQPDEWIDWAIKNKIDSRIIAFLRFKPDSLFIFNPDSPQNAFPTPRAWAEYVDGMIKGIDYTHPMFQKFVSSAIGTGTGMEFYAFQQLQEKIDFQEILKNPKTIKDINAIDLQFSLIAIVGEWFRKEHGKAECDNLFEMVAQMQPEYAILTIKVCKEMAIEQLRKHASNNKLWKNKLSKEYGRFLRDEE